MTSPYAAGRDAPAAPAALPHPWKVAHDNLATYYRMLRNNRPLEMLQAMWREYETSKVAAIQADRVLRCADGSTTHDFKGQSRCPACGMEGITAAPTSGLTSPSP